MPCLPGSTADGLDYETLHDRHRVPTLQKAKCCRRKLQNIKSKSFQSGVHPTSGFGDNRQVHR